MKMSETWHGNLRAPFIVHADAILLAKGEKSLGSVVTQMSHDDERRLSKLLVKELLLYMRACCERVREGGTVGRWDVTSRIQQPCSVRRALRPALR